VFCFCTYAAKPMTKDSNTTVKGYKNAVQSIEYAATYSAYPLNPPLVL